MPRDHVSRDHVSRDRVPHNRVPRDHVSRDRVPRDLVPRDHCTDNSIMADDRLLIIFSIIWDFIKMPDIDWTRAQ